MTTASGAQYEPRQHGASATAAPRTGASTSASGPDAVVKELRIEWPSGAVQTLRDVPADRIVTVREDEAALLSGVTPVKKP